MKRHHTRREFLKSVSLVAAGFAAGCATSLESQRHTRGIMTVLGPIEARQLGTSLIHEHVTTDFIGADRIPNHPRYDHQLAYETVLPHFQATRDAGVNSLFECTPRYIGRDVLLLRRLSQDSGLNLITNTGYYGAVDNRYLPEFVRSESMEQLAARWLSEWERGIDGTDVRPGFIKLGTDSGKLPPLHEKLLRAAALVHRQTGLTLCIHTGDVTAARDELRILREAGIAPQAFVWVHAQNDTSGDGHVEIARQGGWVSLDGYGLAGDKPQTYLKMITGLKVAGLLQHVLISHDNGWSVEGQHLHGATLKSWTDPHGPPYLALFKRLLPDLRNNGFTTADIDQLMIRNPADAFTLRTRLLSPSNT